MSKRSRMTPLGSPDASFSMIPACGSGVALVIFASSSARELATAEWAPARVSTTGLSGAALSRSARVGLRFSVHCASSQPYPVIHSPFPSDAALARSTSWSSAMDFVLSGSMARGAMA